MDLVNKMNKLKKENNNYYITNTKPFTSTRCFHQKSIKKVFDFAYAMTFGEGEHRDHRTGGTVNRKKGQMFINTFQGKLSELAIYNLFYINNKEAYQRLSPPDFEVYGLGEWDDSDIILDKLKFSIKSTKFYGNLLLLESKDWSKEGEYLPNKNSNKNSIYDYFVLVRIKPDGEKLMKEHKLLYSNEPIDKERLFKIINSIKWEYDITGYITNETLKNLILNDFLLPKNALLNGKIPMDAENYYIQSGDMQDFQELIKRL
jgi:hypothetical protein